MTLGVVPGAERYAVEIRGAAELTGASVTLRLPAECAYERLGPGTLLESRDAPLALAGPRADGSILAASVLKGGVLPVSGDGTLLTLHVGGRGCGAAAQILEATAYDAAGLPSPVVPDLPGSGPDLLLPVLAATVLAWGTMRAWSPPPSTG